VYSTQVELFREACTQLNSCHLNSVVLIVTENTGPTAMVLYDTGVRQIDQMTHSLKILFKYCKEVSTFRLRLERILTGFKKWSTIRIQILPLN
jgi:hypothetical protein